MPLCMLICQLLMQQQFIFDLQHSKSKIPFHMARKCPLLRSLHVLSFRKITTEADHEQEGGVQPAMVVIGNSRRF